MFVEPINLYFAKGSKSQRRFIGPAFIPSPGHESLPREGWVQKKRGPRRECGLVPLPDQSPDARFREKGNAAKKRRMPAVSSLGITIRAIVPIMLVVLRVEEEDIGRGVQRDLDKIVWSDFHFLVKEWRPLPVLRLW